MTQLQSKNPQAFQLINQARNSGANPQMLMKQMMSNIDKNSMQQVLTQAKQFGVPDNVLQQIQNIK